MERDPRWESVYGRVETRYDRVEFRIEVIVNGQTEGYVFRDTPESLERYPRKYNLILDSMVTRVDKHLDEMDK